MSALANDSAISRAEANEMLMQIASAAGLSWTPSDCAEMSAVAVVQHEDVPTDQLQDLLNLDFDSDDENDDKKLL